MADIMASTFFQSGYSSAPELHPMGQRDEESMRRILSFWEQEEISSASESESRKLERRNPTPAAPVKKYTSGYESAGNKTTPNKRPNKRRRRSYRDSLASRYKRGKPGSRRNQRWLNELFLGRRKEEPFDFGALESELMYLDLFVDNFSSPLSRLFADDTLFKCWRPFICVTEEQQQDLMDVLYYQNNNQFDDDDSDEDFYPYDENETDAFMHTPTTECIYGTHYQSFQKLDKETKKLLKKYVDSQFFHELDEVVFNYKVNSSLNLPMEMSVQQYELFRAESVLMNGQGDTTRIPASLANTDCVYLFMKDSYHRYLLHGICKFYDLNSQSVTLESGERVTIVNNPNPAHRRATDPDLQMCLSEYLLSTIVPDEQDDLW